MRRPKKIHLSLMNTFNQDYLTGLSFKPRCIGENLRRKGCRRRFPHQRAARALALLSQKSTRCESSAALRRASFRRQPCEKAESPFSALPFSGTPLRESRAAFAET